MQSFSPKASDANISRSSGSIFANDISPLLFRKALVILFLIGLFVRVGFILEHARNPSFGIPTLDQKYYDTVARMLLAGEDLRELHGFRPLLYPMFLALWYKLGGNWGVDLALLVQHLLGIATGLVIAVLGARLFRHRLSGVIGGLLYLLAPVPMYFEGELLIEPSYTFLICVNLLLVARAAEVTGRKVLWLWIACGALTVLIAQARANILVFLAVYPLFAAWQWWRSRRGTALVPLSGLIGALAMAVVWGFVNMKQSEHFHLIPNAGGVNLYLGNKRTADGMTPEQGRRITTGERYQDSVEVWAREEYDAAMRAQGREPDTDPMAISRYWTHRTLDEIKADPGKWLHLVAKKCWLTFWNEEVPNNKAFAFLQTEFFMLRLLPIRWVVLLVLAPAGIWAAMRWGQRNSLFILLVYAGFYSAGNVAFFICDRYRYPVWPVMAALAGGGVFALAESIRRRWKREIGILTVVMIALAALSLHNWFGARLPTFARDYLFRSFACFETGHYEEALSDINASIQLDPRDATALHHRGNIFFAWATKQREEGNASEALNGFAKARSAYEEARTVAPEDASVWNGLGAALDELGRPEEALLAYRRSIAGHPPSHKAFVGMAVIYIRKGELNEAAAVLDQLQTMESRPSATTLAIRSVIARRKGDEAEGKKFEEQARRLDAEMADWAIKQTQRPFKLTNGT